MGRIKDLPNTDHDHSIPGGYFLVVDGPDGTKKVSTGRDQNSNTNTGSFAWGIAVKATGQACAAFGSATTASGFGSFASGDMCIASGNNTYAIGGNTNAEGNFSSANGYECSANSAYSHAGGWTAKAAGSHSFSHGHGTETNSAGEVAFGEFNVINSATTNADKNMFSLGYGLSASRSNLFSINRRGEVKAKSTITPSTAADYAEYFEWVDGNPNEEDRVGKFVTFSHDNKIRIAAQNDDYILGIVSGCPAVCGNGDCDVWNGMDLRDEFDRFIYEDVLAKEMTTDESGNVVESQVFDENGDPVYEKRRIINPEYDNTQPYIPRSIRPEWSPVGMLGVLSVYDDGTCEVNGYAQVGQNGTATKADSYIPGKTYRVLERRADDIVRVVFR